MAPLVLAGVGSARAPQVQSWVGIPLPRLISATPDSKGPGFKQTIFMPLQAFGPLLAGRPRQLDFLALEQSHPLIHSILFDVVHLCLNIASRTLESMAVSSVAADPRPTLGPSNSVWTRTRRRTVLVTGTPLPPVGSFFEETM